MRRQRRHARLQLAEEGGEFAQERALPRAARAIAAPRCGGRVRDELLDVRRATTGTSAPKVMSRLRNSAACSSATGATSRGGRLERAEEAPQAACSGAARLRATGLEVVEQRPAARAIASFRSWPRPASPVPKPGSALLDAAAGRLGEGVEDLVDLDRLGARLPERDRVARREAVGRAARRDLHVLQAERGARADDQRGVHRQRLDVLLELQAELRRGLAVAGADRRDRRRPRPRGRRRCERRCRPPGRLRSARRPRARRSGTNGRPVLAL